MPNINNINMLSSLFNIMYDYNISLHVCDGDVKLTHEASISR